MDYLFYILCHTTMRLKLYKETSKWHVTFPFHQNSLKNILTLSYSKEKQTNMNIPTETFVNQ